MFVNLNADTDASNDVYARKNGADALSNRSGMHLTYL